MNLKYFDEGSPANAQENFYVFVNPSICSAQDLLVFFYHSLWLPGYFGFNWDALYDCLCDLSWIKPRKIIFVHETLPNLGEDDLQIYLKLLIDVSAQWAGRYDDLREFVFLFSANDKNKIEKITQGF